MNFSEARALGDRWVKAGGEWRPGMRAIGQYPESPVRVIEFGERPFDDEDAREADPFQWWQEPRQGEGGPYPGPYVPDLRDAATRGAALDVVRERYPDAYLMPLWADLACTQLVWVVCRESSARGLGRGATEAEALVSALESKESA